MKRGRFTGTANIIRFNWHFYVIAIPLIIVCLYISSLFNGGFQLVLIVLTFSGAAVIFTSLFVSWYIYDHSELYSLSWFDKQSLPKAVRIANIHAGFDETSALLKNKYPGAVLDVFDFYDARKHTEVSIERARKTYPPYPGTVIIDTSKALPASEGYDIIFLILAVHEIRNDNERTEFFRLLSESLKPEGRIIVVEHQRDFVNFLAFNIGFFHFHSPKTWLNNFKSAGLKLNETINITPFLKVYNLSLS